MHKFVLVGAIYTRVLDNNFSMFSCDDKSFGIIIHTKYQKFDDIKIVSPILDFWMAQDWCDRHLF